MSGTLADPVGLNPTLGVVRGGARYAIALLDASMLIVATVLAATSGLFAGVSSPGTGSLVAFGVLCFGLLVLSRRWLDGEPVKPLTPWCFVYVPLLTTVAAAALALWQALLFSVDQPAMEAARPWLLATAYLLAGRLAFAWAISHHPVGAVAQAVDRGVKRAFDAVVAGALLVLAAPVIALIALAVKLEDGGPVLFSCPRCGELGRDLPMLKFRKMRRDADGPPLTTTDDDRFTRVGRFLASSKLDELPQLWNVLRGEMSLVGPRPEDPWFVAMHPDDFAEITGVKPGVTGLCQLAFVREGEILDREDRVLDYSQRLLPQKIAMDLLYARRRTFLFDVQILVWTVVALLLRKDIAVNRESAKLTLRRRPSTEQLAVRAT